MTQKKYIVRLSPRERRQVEDITRKGKSNARVILRARILLKAHDRWDDERIAAHMERSVRTVIRIRERFDSGGLERALYDAPRPGQPKKIDDATEARLVALACSEAPEGRERWTLELLQKALHKELKKKVSTVAIWHHLIDRQIKPWREKNVVHPESDA